ncbi:MAG: MlaD family protein [Deltaproteobacteria bacterium]|jgi:phospholipid/cholesterol/gamma-HCH transport system substrate-binding protein/paraquat-inducible protein B|nr:MlaD family protein [Deltaproteobacteria bacterium]
MARKSTYFKVGAFSLAAFAVLAGGVLLFGVAQSLAPLLECETYFNHSVHGLSNGSNVNFRGFKVGQVTGISLARESNASARARQMVKVTFNINPALITGDSGGDIESAKLFLAGEMADGLRIFFSFQGISGLTFLNLDYDDDQSQTAEASPADGPTPPDGAQREPYPFPNDIDQGVLFIPSSQGSIMEYGESLTQILRSLREVNFGEISRDLSALVKNLNQISARLNRDTGGFADELVGTLAEVKRAAGEVATLSQSANSTLGALTLAESLQELERTVAATRQTLARLDSLLKLPQTTLPSTLDNLRIMSENLRELSDLALRNPSQLLFGSPPPREIPR